MNDDAADDQARRDLALLREAALQDAPSALRELIPFIEAVTVDDRVEAKRLYDGMGPDARRGVNAAEARYYLAPGYMKIWLREPKDDPPSFAGSEPTAEERAAALATAAYEYWKWKVIDAPSAAAFRSLATICETLGKTAEARAARDRAFPST